MQSVLQMIWDSLVSIETMLNAGRSSNWGSFLGRARDFFLFPITSSLILKPTQPLMQRVPGAISLGLKRLGHETGHIDI
jgi:hypothetical protein